MVRKKKIRGISIYSTATWNLWVHESEEERGIEHVCGLSVGVTGV